MPGFGAKAIESPQRLIQLLALKKTGGGTPAISGLCASFCSITDNGVGDYTILVNRQAPFSQILVSSALAHSTTPGIITVHVAGTTALAVQIKTFAVDGTTPAEVDFDLIVIGSSARDLVGI